VPYGGEGGVGMLHLSNRRNELGDLNFFVCFYYEDIINFTPGKFPQILIPRTILMNHLESYFYNVL
jgi:hypothetical protein